MDGPKLYIEPTLTHYAGEQLKDFIAALTAQDKHTVMAPMDQAEQLILKPDCTTMRGGFRLGVVAFRQLCRITCPGLSNVVTDIAGLRRRKNDSDRNRFSLADAIMMLNTVIRRRFRTELDGLQTVRDTRTGVIEGIVGRSYRRLPNLELYNRSAEVLKNYRQPVEFFGANLYGRYMVLHYRDKTPIFSVTVEARRNFEDVYHGGFYYSNSEIGDGSVRATTTVIRATTDTKALGNFGRHGRLIHAGKDFTRRFEMLLNNVAERRPEVERLKAGVIRLMAQPLGFGGSEDSDEKRFLDLAHALQAKQLTKSLAKRILRGVLLQSSYDQVPVTDIRYVQRTVWPSRTAYDLFNSMIRLAPSLPITLQERVEQLAHALLLGRFTLNPGRT
jgi:hypothetical protein